MYIENKKGGSNFIYKTPIIVSIIALSLFIFCKSYLRELHFKNSIIIFLLGIAPNFFAAIVISMTTLINYKKISCEQIVKKDKEIKIWFTGIMLGFIFEEIRPTFSNSQVFDIWDIVFSAIGLLISYSIYSRLKTQKYYDCESKIS